MTNDDKKMLTEEILGECWHRPDYGSQMINPKFYIGVPCACGKVSYNVKHEKKSNRTFTSWQDLGDLKERIVKVGEWARFLYFAKCQFYEERHGYKSSFVHTDKFTDWLMDPIRFPELVLGWVRERGKG